MPSKSSASNSPALLEQRRGAESARDAGLRYVSDARPGIRRQKGPLGFRYIAANGRIIRAKNELARIVSLAIPPAWRDVWICSDPRGHLQATGRDKKGRKQYRYHPEWRACRDSTKYDRLLAFATALPKIRRRTRADIARGGLPREKVLATVVQLLEKSLIRIGNDEYAKENRSFGLTTMRNRHVAVHGSKVRFEFRGKSGRRHSVNVDDRRLARVIRACQDLPGQELFEYLDEHGRRRDVGSAHVNEYLREITGEEFTAKDFRTWAGTVLACLALRDLVSFDSQARARKNIVQAVEAVAGVLGNTKAVCRRSYIHPAVLDSYMDGSMTTMGRQVPHAARKKNGLRPEEAAVLALLQQRLSKEVRRRKAA